MLNINIPESDIQLLREERFTHPHPHVMRKIEVVYLKGLGFCNDDIEKISAKKFFPVL
jgi:hypothetical protein